MSSQEALEVFSLHCREIQSTQLPTRTAMGNSGSSLALLNRKVCTEASTTGAGKEGISIRHDCQAAPKGHPHSTELTRPLAQSKGSVRTPFPVLLPTLCNLFP